MHPGKSRLTSILIMLGLSGSAHTAPLAIGAIGPFQASSPSSGMSMVPMYSWLDREDYHYAGASILLRTAITEENRYVPEKQYRWRFDWYLPNGTNLYVSYTYQPLTDCIYDDATGYAFCNISAREVGQYKTFKLFTGMRQRCVPEDGTYAIAAKLDGLPVFDHPYQPSPFRVGTPSVELTQKSIHPAVRAGTTLDQDAIDPGRTTVTATVKDAWGCDASIAGARVEIENTLPEESAGHYHFAADEQGTGEYTAVSNSEFGINADETSLWAISDDKGEVTAVYRAGYLGAVETVSATALNRPDPDWPYPDKETLQTANDQLHIKVPGLVHLERSGTTYGLKGSGSVIDRNHNRDAITRNSHWVTPYAYTKAQALSDYWSIIDPDGKFLCYNDGSLEHGGTFDAGNRPPDYPDAKPQNWLHFYHQVGKDVDINRFGCPGHASFVAHTKDDDGVVREMDITMTYEGRERDKRKVLDLLAKELNGLPYPESTIHYRFH